jgi:hypothetical protein
MHKLNRLTSILTALTVALLAPPASSIGARVSVNCTWTVPNKVTSGDFHYGVENGWDWCNSAWLKGVADGYGMAKDDWDEGLGWDDACNTSRPFGRVATAKVALQVSAENRQKTGDIDDSKPFTEWASLWAVRTVDELRCFCDDDAVAAQIPNGDYIKLNIRNKGSVDSGWFFGFDVPERTSIFLHEARHQAGGYDHRADGRDQRYTDRGAYRTQINWLWWYAHVKRNAPEKLLCSAQDFANTLLGERFVEDPGFVIDEISCP